jgi:hypothetical protein
MPPVRPLLFALAQALTLAACGGAVTHTHATTPASAASASAEEASQATTFSDGTYVLKEVRHRSETRLTLTRVDDAYFDAYARDEEPGARCIAVGDAAATSFECFVPGRDEWVRFDLESAPEQRVVSVSDRSPGVSASFAREALVLRRANTLSLVGPRFVRDTLRDGSQGAEYSCVQEYGEGSALCPTLDAVLGDDRETLLHSLVRRVGEHDGAKMFAPIDALHFLKQVLRRAIRACSGSTVTTECIDRSISENVVHDEDGDAAPSVRITALAPAERARLVYGVWMPRETIAEYNADESVDIQPSGASPLSLLVTVYKTGERAGAFGPPVTSEWQTYDNFRLRLVGDRLELRRISDGVGVFSDDWAYSTYYRIDTLCELLEQNAAAVGHRHGSETTAILGGLVDAVFGDAPRARAERIRTTLESEFSRHGLSADTLSLEDTQNFVGEFLLGIGVHCAQVVRDNVDREAFSTCVDAALPQLAEVHVQHLTRRLMSRTNRTTQDQEQDEQQDEQQAE